MNPFLNKVATEPPIIADPEGGELAVPEQPVDRRSVDPQRVRQLIGGKQFTVCHFWGFRFQERVHLRPEVVTISERTN